MKTIFFDTETTGLPPRNADPIRNFDKFPHIVQLSWIAPDGTENDYIIKPEGWIIPYNAERIHHISTYKAQEVGKPRREVLKAFCDDATEAQELCAHNIEFDINIILANLAREYGKEGAQMFYDVIIANRAQIDTMMDNIDLVGATFKDGTPGKYPKLEELYYYLFNETFNAHNAMADVRAVKRCYEALGYGD